MRQRAIILLFSCTLGLALCSLTSFLSSCSDGDLGDENAALEGSSENLGEASPTYPSPPIPESLPTPSPAAKAGTMETSPGLRQKKFIAPLQDAYERMDPSKDGWASEATRW